MSSIGKNTQNEGDSTGSPAPAPRGFTPSFGPPDYTFCAAALSLRTVFSGQHFEHINAATTKTSQT